jgi:hypothetical protein
MPGRSGRVDEKGRAYAGSQRQIQTWVNERTDELSRRVQAAIGLTEPGVRLSWVSPLSKDRYVEYQDLAFLWALGMEQYAEELSRFWPRGGPVWDALAVVEGLLDGKPGAVLVEAKSHVPEVFGGGCKASTASLIRIEAALNRTKVWLGVPPEANWTGPLYQSANRLAHLYFLRKVVGVPAWLVNAYFVDDPRSPTSEAVWREAIFQSKRELGLGSSAERYVASLVLLAT